jgi:multimeric flavodoxin WrbA
MKVVAINGSPHKEGNTYHALKVIGSALESNGIEFEIVHIGAAIIQGCRACGTCQKNKDEECGIKSDPVNKCIQKMKDADGIMSFTPKTGQKNSRI